MRKLLFPLLLIAGLFLTGCTDQLDLSEEFAESIRNSDRYIILDKTGIGGKRIGDLLSYCTSEKFFEEINIPFSNLTSGVHQSEVTTSSGLKAGIFISNKIQGNEISHMLIDLSVKGETDRDLKNSAMHGIIFNLSQCDASFDRGIFLIKGITD